MRNNANRERGQALVLVTVALIAMVGVLSLATDLGTYYFMKKAAQGAADAAAMAAVKQVLATVGNGAPHCGGNVACGSAMACTGATLNLENGCLYARQNGFTSGGRQGRQSVTADAGTGVPPTAPGVNNIAYWVTFRVGERMPRLFSAMVGGEQGVSARATAVVTEGVRGGTVWLLNRQNDVTPVGAGVNVDMGGNTTLSAPGGIYMASNKDGAGHIQGTPNVTAPFTYIRTPGKVTAGGNANWTAAPTNSDNDALFTDPMGGQGQPPAPAELANEVEVLNGCLSCLTQPLSPGHYFAVNTAHNPTGARLTINSTVTFEGGAFGEYVLYGGLSVGATANIGPGRYVIAGVRSGGNILELDNHANMTDNGPAGQPDDRAGEIFILTDANYPGLRVPQRLSGIKDSLKFGPVNLQSGNKQVMNLHGLNRERSLPEGLKDFAPAAFWQDQGNSRIMYDDNGNVVFEGCGANLDTPCLNPGMANSTTPAFHLQAHPNTNVYGMIYQPRGAWLSLQGNGTVNSAMAMITGALSMGGGADIKMLRASDQLRRRITALVE